MAEWFFHLQEGVLALVDTPWILLVIFLFTIIDGFFPPIPSESLVIAAGVLSVSGAGAPLGLLILAAAGGAFVGDMIAFHIGRYLPIEKIPVLRGQKAQKVLQWAERALKSRATVFIMSARFIPVGRVAVNVTAGAVGFPRLFFIVIDSLAAIFWACYSVALGLAFGHILKDMPLLGVALGVSGGVLIGFILDFILKRIYTRVLERRGERAAEAFQSEDD